MSDDIGSMDRMALRLEVERLTALLNECREALEFYAPENSYDYDKTQGVNYIWNDQGKRARQALTKPTEVKDE